MERTLSIIKPDAVANMVIGAIIKKFEDNGLKVVAHKRILMTIEQAKQFYYIHKDRPFYNDLVNYMCSGPVHVQVLEGQNAVLKNRDLMGATNPAEAKEGTIRKEFGASIDKNAVHGSDSVENAVNEIKFFFSDMEIC